MSMNVAINMSANIMLQAKVTKLESRLREIRWEAEGALRHLTQEKETGNGTENAEKTG